MLNGRCRVIFWAVCGNFRGGVRLFLQRSAVLFATVAVLLYHVSGSIFCFLLFEFVLLAFIFTPVSVYFSTCLSLFSHVSEFIFTRV